MYYSNSLMNCQFEYNFIIINLIYNYNIQFNYMIIILIKLKLLCYGWDLIFIYYIFIVTLR